jgi:hypothetical protein
MKKPNRKETRKTEKKKRKKQPNRNDKKEKKTRKTRNSLLSRGASAAPLHATRVQSHAARQ